MVKKKGKNLPPSEPEETEPSCKHIRKSLEEGAVKRALINVDWTLCQDCPAETGDKTSEAEEEPVEEGVIWLCLKCGHRGCGRYSKRQHALHHYNTPRSEPHCLVLSVGEWQVWCYLCDNEVQCSSSGRLRQLVDFIQKKSKANVKIPNKAQSPPAAPQMESKSEIEKAQRVEEPNPGAKGDKPTNNQNDGKEVTVKGLSNLGNTCFFNAVMQNLSQTPALRELLNEVKCPGRMITLQVPDDPQPRLCEVTLEQQPGPLTSAMWQFLSEMQEAKKGVVTPKELFSQVCKKAIRFRGYQQQDSQELLRYLLDGMRGEEIQRGSSAISKSLQDASEKRDEEELKKIVRDYEKRRAIPNFVDRLFGGELTSTIMCETCHTVSLVHEPFLDLSLPVLDDSPPKKNTAKPAKISEKRNEEEENDDSYVKERNDLPSGPSKHLQKKAKKQAKKQAKNQRRQQKLMDRTLPLNETLEDQPDSEDPVPENDNAPEISEEQQDVSKKEGVPEHSEEEESCLISLKNGTQEATVPPGSPESVTDDANNRNELESRKLDEQRAENEGLCSKNMEIKDEGLCSKDMERKDEGLCSKNMEIEDEGLCSKNMEIEDEGLCSKNMEIKDEGLCSKNMGIKDEALFSKNVEIEDEGLCSKNVEIKDEALFSNNVEIEDEGLCSKNVEIKDEGLCSKNMEIGVYGLYSQKMEVQNDSLCSKNMEIGDEGLCRNNREIQNEDISQMNVESYVAAESPLSESDPVEDELTKNLNQLNLTSDLQPNIMEIEVIDKVPSSPVYEVVNEDPKTAFSTLSERKELPLDEWSVLSCLYQFTRKENLVGNNQLLCNTCTQRQAKAPKQNNKVEKKFAYSNAKKQMLVSAPPPILTLHLKRFQQNGFNLHKINKHIKFPEVMDLGPFCTVKCKSITEGESRLLYSLYGVIEHSGTMRSGHYTAYVKSRIHNPRLRDLVLQGVLPDEPSTEPTRGPWFHISDSQVQAVPLSKVLGAQAYLLFYERIL